MSWKFLDNNGRLKELIQQYGITPTHQVFTSGSGTYSTPAGCVAILVECLAGGGGGGSAQTGSNATWAAASGGNGGCYSQKLITNPNASYAYSVGAGGTASPGGTTLSNGGTGGDTTFGSSLVVAKGGVGGTQDGQAGHTSFAAVGTSVPTTSGCVGDYFNPGDRGHDGVVFASSELIGGGGGRGGGPLGGTGGGNTSATGNGTGQAGIGYGSGGGGSTAGNFSGADVAAGVGKGGLIVVTEFYGTRPTGGGKPNINFTSQDFSLGPPSNPLNGDIWYATNVDSNGTTWQFRYNAGSSSAYKWEFIGGSPMIVADGSRTARTTTSNSAWNVLSGVGTITTARGGDYIYHVSGWMQGSVGSITYVGVGNTGGIDPNIHYVSENASNSISQAAHGIGTSLAANYVWSLRMFTSDFTTASITDPAFSILPVRVS